MSKNEANANKGDGGTAFQTADEIRDEKDAGDYIPRDVRVHDTSGARVTEVVVEVENYDGERRSLFLSAYEAGQLLDGLTEAVDGVSL